jgi:hypothetical protein
VRVRVDQARQQGGTARFDDLGSGWRLDRPVHGLDGRAVVIV